MPCESGPPATEAGSEEIRNSRVRVRAALRVLAQLIEGKSSRQTYRGG